MKIVEYNKIKSSVYNVLLEYFYHRTKKKIPSNIHIEGRREKGNLDFKT